MMRMLILIAVGCMAMQYDCLIPVKADDAPTASRPANRPWGLPEGLPPWVYEHPGSVSTQPVELGNPSARKAHEGYLQQVADVKAGKAKIDLLFIGDSITACWNGEKKLFDQHYGRLGAAAFGVGGDQSQNVLWRLVHGEIEGLSPKVVVLLIGTNQMHDQFSVQDVIAGHAAIIKVLREKLPNTKILLLGVFPNKNVSLLEKIRKTNAELAKLADGKNVRFLDFGDKLLDAQGQVTQETFVDGVHLTHQGYQIWAREMNPLLMEMLGVAASEPAGKDAP